MCKGSREIYFLLRIPLTEITNHKPKSVLSKVTQIGKPKKICQYLSSLNCAGQRERVVASLPFLILLYYSRSSMAVVRIGTNLYWLGLTILIHFMLPALILILLVSPFFPFFSNIRISIFLIIA